MEKQEPPGEFAFTTETLGETNDYLAAHLARNLSGIAGLTDADWVALAELTGLVDRVEDKSPANPDAAPGLIRRWRWVVRTEDLKMFDSMADSAGSGLGFGVGLVAATGAAALPWAALFGAVVHVFKLAHRARVMGATLDPRSWAVVATLHSEGPMEASHLLDMLHAHDGTWTRDELDATLKRLTAYPASGGSSLSLVASDGGTWRLTGV